MGKSKKQHTGNAYSLGQHFILCSNPAKLIALRFDSRKLAWTGNLFGGKSARISRPNLFGGDDKEGGVSGVIRVHDGKATQGKNAYLIKNLGDAATSAFRFVTGVVFEGVEIGKNYYPKRPSFKLVDTYIFDLFQPQTSRFVRDFDISNAEIHIAIDTSGSMSGTRFALAKQTAATLIRKIKSTGAKNRIKVQFAQSAVGPSQTVSATTAQDYENLAVWVEGMSRPDGQFYVDNITTSISAFFSTGTSPDHSDILVNWKGLLPAPSAAVTGRRISIIMSDGGAVDYTTKAAEYLNIPAIESYAFAISAANTQPALVALDNTPEDSVHRIDGVNDISASFLPFASWVDVNPVNIVYDLLTSTEENTTKNSHLIGNSFSTVATTLHGENFGLSFFWDSPSELDKFRKTIEEHIDGAIFFSRATGKWEIKLIREDYVKDDLPYFGLKNVSSWKTDVNRERESSLVNRVILTYSKRSNGEPASITVSDRALVDRYGPNAVKIKLEGIHDSKLAARVARRELRSRSQVKWAGTIVAHNVPADLDRGSAFVLHNPLFGINNIVARVAEIELTADRSATIKFVEDKFTLLDVGDIEVVDPTIDTIEALDAEHVIVDEAPYYPLVFAAGQSAVDNALEDNDDLGYIQTACAAPSGYHVSAEAWLTTENTDTNFSRDTNVLFCPNVTTTEELSKNPTQTTVKISNVEDLAGVNVNALASIGDEIIRVDSYAEVSGDVVLTIGRGCLDTIPLSHPSGSKILFWGDFLNVSQESYITGENVGQKILTATTSDELTLSEATTHRVEFKQRAFSPYRPGALQINGSYDRVNILPASGGLTLSWKHRNRTFQTTAIPEDYLADNIGPETGTTYSLEIFMEDAVGTKLETLFTIDLASATTYNVVEDLEAARTAASDNAENYVFAITSLRDGVSSYTAARVECSAFSAPRAFTIVEE